MRALLLCAVLAGIVGAGWIACNPNSIGRPCVNAVDAGVRGPQVSSPALECPSRLCLLEPTAMGGTAGTDGGYRATCTAGCDTTDDCDPETKSQCAHGFVCAVAVTTGPFCCRKMCICKDDLSQGINVDVDGGVIKPASCTRSAQNPTPTCPNI